MKVIDLLNKIANDEETPEKIKYNNIVYHRQWNDYMGDEPIDEYYIDDNNFSWMTEMDLKLDSEIEIIEEPKKIEKLENWYSVGFNDEYIKAENIYDTDVNIVNKINEIIDYINKEQE